ncbi:unnamed protein product, partial [Iphiclides podalirius]
MALRSSLARYRWRRARARWKLALGAKVQFGALQMATSEGARWKLALDAEPLRSSLARYRWRRVRARAGN